MKALTLLHPWPFCIAELGKRIENRSWRPPRSVTAQRFAIHGAAAPTSRRRRETILNQMRWVRDRLQIDREFDIEEILSFAGIVATAQVQTALTKSDDPWFDGTGFGWVLADVIVMPKPIPCKGAQGLWNVPSDVLVQVLTAGKGVRDD